MNNTIINNTVNNNEDKDNVKLCISADTYLERVFYNLCAQDSRKVRIYYEWQNNKNRYMHQTAIIAHDFPHYSVHDQEHSRTIIEAVEMFLGKWRIEQLGIGNAWLLLNAAYGHDIGMVIQHQEILELWREDKEFKKYLDNICNNPDSDMQEALQYCRQLHNVLHKKEKLDGIDSNGNVFQIYELTNDWPVIVRKNVMMITADYIRSHHQERSKKFFENLSETIGIEIAENRLYSLLGQVVYSHGCDLDYILNELPSETNGFGNEKIYPQFIALLLRLGDLLDMDNNRFDIMLLQHFGALPKTSAKHLQKHLSISHFLVTEREIQAKAKVTNMEVGKVVDQWFHFIKDEVNNITSNWNRVSPKEMGGCTFNQCNLEIYLNERKFASLGKTNFEVDNKRFMSILIGDRLYEEQLVFLREYIQNALDATKLMLWLKWQMQDNTHVFDIDENGGVNQTLSGLNFQTLDDYAIKIKMELIKENVLEDSETEMKLHPEKIRIHIIDSGVGMDKECMKALAVIGTGWSGRKQYYEEIGRMPAWLQPTGSFGVGIQTGFMMTDKIRIITHGMKEQHGLDICLKSPRKTGTIDYMVIQNEKVGTEIILDIDWTEFLDKLQQSFQADQKISTKTGIFDYGRIMKEARDYLLSYICQMVPNSLVPIEIAVRESSERFDKGKKVTSYLRTFLAEKEKIKRSDRYNVDYKLSDAMNIVYFWMKDEQVFICMKNLLSLNKKKEYLDEFYYKGVNVKHKEGEGIKKINLVSDYIPVCIDTMGMKASECLLISRSYFTENMHEKFMTWAWKCLEVYVDIVAASISKTKEQFVQLENIAYLLLMGALYFGENSDTENLCLTNDFIETYEMQYIKKEGRRYVLSYMNTSFQDLYKWIAVKEKPIVWKIQDMSKVYGNDEKIVIDFMSVMGEEEEEDQDATDSVKKAKKPGIREKAEKYLREALGTGNQNCIITDIVMVDLLEEFICKTNKKRTLLRIANMDKEEVLLSVYDPERDYESAGYKNTEQNFTLKKILIEAIEKNRYYITVGADCDEKYSALYVKSVPLKTDLTENYLKNHRVILFPFNLDMYSTVQKIFSQNNDNRLLGSKDDKQENMDHEEEFKEWLTNSPAWERAIQWTAKYGVNNKGFSERDVVVAQYTKLCEEFYQAYVEYWKKNKNENS